MTNPIMRTLPMLCECAREDGYYEHRDMYGSYILWVLHGCGSHVAFVHRRWVEQLRSQDGRTFAELMMEKDVGVFELF